ILAFELLVFADIGGHHLANLPGLQQQTETEAIDTGVVTDGGELCLAGITQGADQCLGNTAQTEAADGDRHAVLNQPFKSLGGTGLDLFHDIRLLVVVSVPLWRVRATREPLARPSNWLMRSPALISMSRSTPVSISNPFSQYSTSSL